MRKNLLFVIYNLANIIKLKQKYEEAIESCGTGASNCIEMNNLKDASINCFK